MEKHINIMQHNSCGLCCIKIKDINVRDGKDIILKNVNIHMHCGEITCIIGPNGAGKSTLLKAIINEVKHKGTIEYLNKNDDKISKPIMGYVPQKVNIDKTIPISVKDLFNAVGIKEDYNKIVELIEIQDLINKKVGDLSGGEMQKVLLALAMYPLPDILLLDEPLSNIDEMGMKKIYAIINKLREKCDIAIILVSHDLDSVYKYADNVILLDKEIIKQGNPAEVFGSNEFKKIFLIEGEKDV